MPYKDPEKQREADRRWREANPEKVREANRRWREANPEKQREATRRWHEANPEYGRKQSRRWREANLEKARVREVAYRAANREARKSLHGRLQGLSKGRYTPICPGGHLRSRPPKVPGLASRGAVHGPGTHRPIARR